MKLPIQALPKGLVGFLDLNASGAGPPDLADQVVAILDVEKFFIQAKRERLVSSATAAGTLANDFTFSASGLLVPQTECWLVSNYSVSAAIPIGLTVQLMGTYQASSGGLNTAYPVGPPISNTTNAIAAILRTQSSGPFLVPPGGVLAGLTLSISAATAFNATGSVDFVRFRL